ncbi:OsmC family protein [Ottowia sp.]|uniref:OsmC family protein n=1 Tax=Ottowia sp. TaxID=1898956 RepID=UPI002C11D065|nr:OsmC family protein [Ottowia sp.]MCZ2439777.1 OsmC family protein [Burkholderiales bacterium]HNR83529.1 OsmC family protein [Ottowia sp.]
MSQSKETVRLTQVQDYRFHAQFGEGIAVLQTDEPPPLGQGQGPSPVQMLAAAVGNCLSASLLFALRKYKQDPGAIACDVSAEVGRNAENRLRVLQMQATITIGVPGDTLQHLERVLGSFEAFCTVTQSVREGIPVTVSVFDSHGAQLA